MTESAERKIDPQILGEKASGYTPTGIKMFPPEESEYPDYESPKLTEQDVEEQRVELKAEHPYYITDPNAKVVRLPGGGLTPIIQPTHQIPLDEISFRPIKNSLEEEDTGLRTPTGMRMYPQDNPAENQGHRRGR